MSATAESKARYAEAVTWAERNLPQEFAPFAAAAAMTLQTQSVEVTVEAVKERLLAQGRDHESREAK